MTHQRLTSTIKMNRCQVHGKALAIAIKSVGTIPFIRALIHLKFGLMHFEYFMPDD